MKSSHVEEAQDFSPIKFITRVRYVGYLKKNTEDGALQFVFYHNYTKNLKAPCHPRSGYAICRNFQKIIGSREKITRKNQPGKSVTVHKIRWGGFPSRKFTQNQWWWKTSVRGRPEKKVPEIAPYLGLSIVREKHWLYVCTLELKIIHLLEQRTLSSPPDLWILSVDFWASELVVRELVLGENSERVTKLVEFSVRV